MILQEILLLITGFKRFHQKDFHSGNSTYFESFCKIPVRSNKSIL